ncbi:MAG: KH domain-containing protein [Actinobacteria bacterium]|nr:KH domain-containing protein [Actinomycetota bacterium]
MKAKEVLEYVAKQLVDNPDDVEVVKVDGERNTVLELHVNDDDLGKVIGKRGRTAKALRTLVKAAASLDGDNVTVDIVD